MTVWKFPLRIDDEQFIEVPKVNRPLCVQVQAGSPCLCMEVDETAPKIKVRVRTVGTGHPINFDERLYVGTYQVSGGALIFHVYLAGWQE